MPANGRWDLIRRLKVNNNSVINNNCGIVQDFTLLFRIPIGTRKIFFEVYGQFVHAP